MEGGNPNTQAVYSLNLALGDMKKRTSTPRDEVRKEEGWAVMPTLPLLAGDLRFFASSPALPLWYINLPLFTSTINIEYLVKNKTDFV